MRLISNLISKSATIRLVKWGKISQCVNNSHSQHSQAKGKSIEGWTQSKSKNSKLLELEGHNKDIKYKIFENTTNYLSRKINVKSVSNMRGRLEGTWKNCEFNQSASSQNPIQLIFYFILPTLLIPPFPSVHLQSIVRILARVPFVGLETHGDIN